MLLNDAVDLLLLFLAGLALLAELIFHFFHVAFDFLHNLHLHFYLHIPFFFPQSIALLIFITLMFFQIDDMVLPDFLFGLLSQSFHLEFLVVAHADCSSEGISHIFDGM